MTRKQWITVAAGLAIVAAALAWAFSPRAVIAEVAEAMRGPFEQTVDEDGKTRIRERYVVSAPLAGRLQRIPLKAGDAVSRGTVLAVMDPAAPPLIDARTERELQERVGAAQAALARAITTVEHATATLAQNQADLERTRQLSAQGFLSPTQLERDQLKVILATREREAAEFERHAAQHQVELARAALTRSREGWQRGRGERLEIRSPVEGRVLRVAQESEAVVPLGAPLIELGDPSDLEVVVDVLTTDAVQVAPGQAVKLERYGSAPALAGRVRLVEPSAFTKVSALGVEEQRVNVVIDITSPRSLWQNVGDAYRVDARIVVFSRDDALRIPSGALYRDGQNWAAFVVTDGVARKRIVKVTRRSGRDAMVGEGLSPGERVVVYPGDAVRDGARVRAR